MTDKKENKEKKIVVGVILARGGSKRVLKKNIRLIKGKPVLAYTIESAIQSHALDRVILSTDDPEIAEIGKKYGAEVPFMRPAHLAQDDTHTPPVIEHAIAFIEKQSNCRVDVVVTLEPTSPLRKPEQIVEGITQFLRSKADSLMSVSIAFPPWWLFYLEKDGKLVTFIEYKKGVNALNLESQELPPVYKPNGVLYVTDREYLRKHNSIVNPKNCIALVTDEESAKDIDSEIDIQIIESILDQREKANAKTGGKTK